MATTGEVEAYLDFHPFRDWTEDRWDERSAIIDTRFHQTDVFYTPLIGSSMTMPAGVGWDQYWYVGAELVPAHVNHNTIGRYQRMMGPLYVDTRQRKVRARDRWGAKIQLDKRDQMVTRYGSDTPTFITQVLRSQLADNIVGQQEKVARDGILDNVLFHWMHDGSAFVNGTKDFSDLPTDDTGLFDVTLLEDVALRMSYRVEDTLRAYGTYAQPVPGSDFRNSVLVMVTTPTFWGIWNSDEQEYMIDLRQLRDQRIINGGSIEYRNMVVQDTGYKMVLWNAGTIDKQKRVTNPINFGDGATDAASAVDSMWYTGQDGDDVKNYIQCGSITAGDFSKGDVVSIHTAQTNEYGITGGCDPLHGKTVKAEVYSIDASNNRITLRKPLTEEFVDQFQLSYLAGSSNTNLAYAVVTKAQHVHPVVIVGAREMVQFVRRLQPDGSFVEFNRPPDNAVDFPSIERVTANWYGEVNAWNLDVYEIFYTAAKFGNRGALAYA
jgi:hypothetical protein